MRLCYDTYVPAELINSEIRKRYRDVEDTSFHGV